MSQRNLTFIGGPNDRFCPSTIPDGWQWVRLTEYSKLETGHTPDRDISEYWNGDIHWVSLQDSSSLDAPEIMKTANTITLKGIENSSARLLPRGTVICSRTATIGKSTLLGTEMATSQDFMNYVCGEKIDSKYLMYAFRGMERTWDCIKAGSTHSTIYKSDFENMRMLLPPISEQSIIAQIFLNCDRLISLTRGLTQAKLRAKHAVLQHVLDRAYSGWTAARLGDLFVNRKVKGTSGLRTYSVTMNRGLVPRDSLDRKNDTALEPEQHLLIERGDIAYNMMRMWQGASGLATDSGLVSPAYVVIRSRGKVDPLFASYWFKMPRVVKKFQDYSHGLTKDRLRLYYKDFASIALPLPPLKLQQQIAEFMHCCDRELDALDRKLELLKQQKKGLMQQLLTGKTRVKLPKGTA